MLKVVRWTLGPLAPLLLIFWVLSCGVGVDGAEVDTWILRD